jgi:hypothetical protein
MFRGYQLGVEGLSELAKKEIADNVLEIEERSRGRLPDRDPNGYRGQSIKKDK